MKVRITLNEEMLGMLPSSKDIYREFIASKAPDASTMEEEVEEFGVDVVEEKGITVFPRDEDGVPFMWDYQIKGFFKDSMQMLIKAGKAGYEGGKHCAQVRAYKKLIDGTLFIFPRQIKIHIPEGKEMGYCSRSLRINGIQERTCVAKSETVPAGSTLELEIILMGDTLEKPVKECLDYGEYRGLGQWRNSGKGVFSWELLT